jgi:hypothetical protein
MLLVSEMRAAHGRWLVHLWIEPRGCREIYCEFGSHEEVDLYAGHLKIVIMLEVFTEAGRASMLEVLAWPQSRWWLRKRDL